MASDAHVPWSTRASWQGLGALIYACALTIANTELGHGFWTAETLVLAAVGLGTAAVAGLFLLLRLAQRRWASARGYGLVVLAFAFSIVASRPLLRHHEARSKAAASPIITALESYQRQHGRPPVSLSELVPERLASIPDAPVAFIRRVPFDYGIDSDGQFHLSFPAPHGYWHIYHSHTTAWSMHD